MSERVNRSSEPTTRKSTPPLIAHRGASFDAPENTLASFRLAIEQGADGIEGDFYLTADGQIVCMHDSTTKRTAGEDRVVGRQTLAELKLLDAGAWKDARFKGEPIPTLREILSVLPPGKRFYIEIKDGIALVPVLAEELKNSRVDRSQIRIIGFDQKVIRAAREQLPDIKAYWLTGLEVKDGDQHRKLTANEVVESLRSANATGLGCKADMTVIDASFVRAIREAGFEWHVWTVDDPEIAAKLRELGVDSITTNRPQYLRDQLAR